MHQQEPSAAGLPHLNGVPQRSQTRLRKGRLLTAAAGLICFRLDAGVLQHGILPCRSDRFKNWREELRQSRGPEPIDPIRPRRCGNIFHSLKAWPWGMA